MLGHSFPNGDLFFVTNLAQQFFPAVGTWPGPGNFERYSFGRWSAVYIPKILARAAAGTFSILRRGRGSGRGSERFVKGFALGFCNLRKGFCNDGRGPAP